MPSRPGHFGQWAVTVDEGDDIRGRQWTVDVVDADEARAKASQAAVDAKAERLNADRKRVSEVFVGRDFVALSKTAIKDETGFNTKRISEVLAAMLEAGELEAAEFSVSGHKPKPGGYRLTPKFGVVA